MDHFIDNEGFFLTYETARRTRLLTLEPHHRTPAALLNLGFIGIGSQKGGVSITLQPRLVSRAGLAGLSYWLLAAAPRRVVLTSLEKGQSPEIYGSIEEAAMRVEELVNAATVS